MFAVKHRPIVDIYKATKLYSKKDGVPISYVCTTALNNGTEASDIFYRETPHPEFGNRYFGLVTKYSLIDGSSVYIHNADKIEDLEFGMVEVNGEYHYSQHRWHCNYVGPVAIDGGRAYTKLMGDLSTPVVTFKVKDGQFIKEGD